MDPGDPLVGQIVGSYRLLELIGGGGMGRVYLAEHPEIQSRVAIKILHPRLGSREEMVRRFLDEAKATNRVGHPGIVRISDCGRHDDVGLYLVMEYLEGVTLARRFHERGRLPVQMTGRILRQAASALHAAHQAGIIHRDLKPSNIFLCRDPDMPGGERAKVLDFGFAKLMQEHASLDEQTKTGSVFGTPQYMAPEQCVDAKAVDGRADIYSLCAIGYQMLGGHLPFEADSFGRLIIKQKTEVPASLLSQRDDMPEALDQAILTGLAYDRTRRFPSMEALGEAIRRALESAGLIDAGNLGSAGSSASGGPMTGRLMVRVEVSTDAEAMPGGRAQVVVSDLSPGGGLALAARRTAVAAQPSLPPSAFKETLKGHDEEAPRPDPRPTRPDLAPTSEKRAEAGGSAPLAKADLPALEATVIDEGAEQQALLAHLRQEDLHVLGAAAASAPAAEAGLLPDGGTLILDEAGQEAFGISDEKAGAGEDDAARSRSEVDGPGFGFDDRVRKERITGKTSNAVSAASPVGSPRGPALRSDEEPTWSMPGPRNRTPWILALVLLALFGALAAAGAVLYMRWQAAADRPDPGPGPAAVHPPSSPSPGPTLERPSEGLPSSPSASPAEPRRDDALSGAGARAPIPDAGPASTQPDAGVAAPSPARKTVARPRARPKRAGPSDSLLGKHPHFDDL